MNDLVFVMYNLKLKQKNQKRAIKHPSPIVLDDLPSDDKWITEIEEPVLPKNTNWLNVLDRAAREATSTVDENNDEEIYSPQNANVEQLEISDDDDAQVYVSSNEVNGSGNLDMECNDGSGNFDMEFDDGDDDDDDDVYVMGIGSSGTQSGDNIDGGNYGYTED